ncbi:hypothetical protein CRG98_043970 [Punica granatum]|uniref:Uncharacterized protein n=1 Tax=Punica granatum TaxID=22663 RepID=A0A2I0HVI3_PUNGR|nr:hypothetical protein CRG98_043970 [Punica granatum]
MHMLRRGFMHGHGWGGLATRERARSVMLMEALGSAKGPTSRRSILVLVRSIMVAALEGKGVLEDVRPTSFGESVRSSWVGELYRGMSKMPSEASLTKTKVRPTQDSSI